MSSVGRAVLRSLACWSEEETTVYSISLEGVEKFRCFFFTVCGRFWPRDSTVGWWPAPPLPPWIGQPDRQEKEVFPATGDGSGRRHPA